jgi:hypothetical protein
VSNKKKRKKKIEATALFLVGILFGILAVVASRKAVIANRASNSADAYVRVDDGYEVESDPRASMYDVYGDLKPAHIKLLKLIEKVADEEKGLTIKVLSFLFYVFVFV